MHTAFSLRKSCVLGQRPVSAHRAFGCLHRVQAGLGAKVLRTPAASNIAVPQVDGSDGNGLPPINSGKGGNGGNNSGGDDIDPQIAAILLAAGRSVADLPKDLAAGAANNKLTTEVLKRFLELEKTFFLGWLVKSDGFRERLLADPSFMVKVGIEVGIGIITKLSAEYTKRQDRFAKEADFVFANCIMAIVADFMLTWLPAPTLAFTRAAKAPTNPILRFWASCPDNAFQKVQQGMEPFSMGQRIGAVLRNGSKLLGVGICASMIGVGITNSLLFVRSLIEPEFVSLNPPQNVLFTSAAYGVYMSTSSNLRYQLVAGVFEERGIEVLFKGKPELCHACSFVIRTLNTFVGSLLWVDFVRLLGMQSAKGE